MMRRNECCHDGGRHLQTLCGNWIEGQSEARAGYVPRKSAQLKTRTLEVICGSRATGRLREEEEVLDREDGSVNYARLCGYSQPRSKVQVPSDSSDTHIRQSGGGEESEDGAKTPRP